MIMRRNAAIVVALAAWVIVACGGPAKPPLEPDGPEMDAAMYEEPEEEKAPDTDPPADTDSLPDTESKPDTSSTPSDSEQPA